MADDNSAGNVLSSEELKKRYKDASWMSAGTGFGIGNGSLGPELRDEVVRRKAAREAKDTAKQRKRMMANGLIFVRGIGSCMRGIRPLVLSGQMKSWRLPSNTKGRKMTRDRYQ